jgi:MFS family permease
VVAFMRKRWRFFLGHFAGYGLLAASAYGFGAWLPTYMVRKFELPISAIGAIVGLMVAVFGMGGTMLSGALADRMFSSGRRDAHLLLFVVLALVQVAVVFGAASADSLPVFLAFVAAFLALASYTGAAAAALQIVTPAEYRGQVSAAYLVVFTLLGIGLGPTLVGALTTYVFADDAMVGWAMAANSAILLPLAALLLFTALKPMRSAVTEAEHWSAKADREGAA